MTAGTQNDGDPVATAIAAARAALEARLDEINDVNVFPVADGDTGTNMLATITAADQAARDAGGGPRAEEIARAVLLAARGNSGMILSQLVRGAAAELSGNDAPTGADARRAFRSASDAAYAAVREPVEGTMLTVARRMADAAERTVGDAPFEQVLAEALAAGWQAVEETTDLLPVLQQAKVVDAGGLGLAVLIDGIVAQIEGREPVPPAEAVVLAAGPQEHALSRFRYCTTFLVTGNDMDLETLEEAMTPFGDSLLVMGDPTEAKVHVHTDLPHDAMAIAEAIGTVSDSRVDDMREQEVARAVRTAARLSRDDSTITALALVGTEELGRIVGGLGAQPVIQGDDPVATISAKLADQDAERAIVVAYGETAAAVADVVEDTGARLVAAPTIQAALSCLVAFDVGDDRDGCADAMNDALDEVTSVEISADTPDPRGALEEHARELIRGGAGLITVLIGASPATTPDQVEAWIREVVPGVEAEAHFSGMPGVAFLIGAE